MTFILSGKMSDEDDFYSVADGRSDNEWSTDEDEVDDQVKRRKPCHLCGLAVHNLCRHLTSKRHSFTKRRAKSEMALYHPRRRRSDLKSPAASRPVRACPVRDCGARMVRLDYHLVRWHGMQKGTSKYRQHMLDERRHHTGQ